MNAFAGTAERQAGNCDPSEGAVTVEVQPGVHPMEAILRAPHRFSGTFYVDVAQADGDLVRVRLKPKAGQPPTSTEEEFRNALLDENLRAIVAERSRAERDLILAHALSRHPVLQAGYEAAEAFTDPFGLLAPDKR